MNEKKTLWLARDENDKLFMYQTRPVKMDDHWTCEEGHDIGVMPDDMFEDIRWEDENPVEIELTIKTNRYGVK